jgi:hypothetical protein
MEARITAGTIDPWDDEAPAQPPPQYFDVE